MKNGRENYAAEVIPQILINCKEYGCVRGDWNAIIENNDATKNARQKQSKCLKRLVKTFPGLIVIVIYILILCNIQDIRTTVSNSMVRKPQD